MRPVLFVGAGPGDPGLLTVYAIAALDDADLVLHDDLVSPEILSIAFNPHPYTGIEQAILAARQGLQVVRLQVGDPTVFGRLTAQMEALEEAGIPYEIVPGVTAATAAAAQAKISLTHPALGRSVALVSGHDPDRPLPDADTVVVYMPKSDLPPPSLIVENAWRSDRGRPARIAILGAVAGLKSLPLCGQRIVVTRAESSGFDRALRALGAEPVPFPVIRIVPPLDPTGLEAAARGISGYDWMVFTSANGVRAYFERVRDLRGLRARLCAIGPATRAEIERLKLVVDAVPPEYVAESLVETLPYDLTGQRILIPRAAVARDIVPEALRARGAMVDVVEAYRTVPTDPVPEPHGPADWITFTSSSTVKNYLALAGRPTAKVASIGPITSATLRMHGIEPAVEASEYTTEGLTRAILGATIGKTK
jgi:uroporphyrinogen III methyltransferase/synthase